MGGTEPLKWDTRAFPTSPTPQNGVQGFTVIVSREVTEPVVSLAVSDVYGVELAQRTPVVEYTAGEAQELGEALIRYAGYARSLIAEDEARWGVAPMFDVLPACDACINGVHASCKGTTYLNSGRDFDEVECGCSKAGHQVLGKANGS